MLGCLTSGGDPGGVLKTLLLISGPPPSSKVREGTDDKEPCLHGASHT